MVESGRVPGKGRIRASIEKLSRQLSKKGGTCVSTEKWQNPNQYREKVESVQLSKNCPGEYRKRVESVWVPKNDRFRESTGKRQNPCDYWNTVPEITRKGSNLCEYQKMEESGLFPEKGRIRVSIDKLSRRVSKKGWNCVSTEKLQDQD